MSSDPTGIKIAFDPTVQRMSGVSAHGLVHFDVPFISKIAPNLWQGGCKNGLLLPRFIKHVVSLYPWESYTVKHDVDSSLTVRAYDSLDQSLEIIDGIARWAVSARRSGPVLIHCQAWLNRSSLVMARVLMLNGMSAGEAITLIREKRSPACLCNPAFERWLHSLPRSVVTAPSAARAEREVQFARRRAEGKPVAEAGTAVGIAGRTARTYEARRTAAQVTKIQAARGQAS